MARPEGFRKALRVMRLAERFNMPIITFIEQIIPYDIWVKYDKSIVDIISPLVGDEITSEIFGLMQLIKHYRENVTVSQILSLQIFYRERCKSFRDKSINYY